MISGIVVGVFQKLMERNFIFQVMNNLCLTPASPCCLHHGWLIFCSAQSLLQRQPWKGRAGIPWASCHRRSQTWWCINLLPNAARLPPWSACRFLLWMLCLLAGISWLNRRPCAGWCQFEIIRERISITRKDLNFGGAISYVRMQTVIFFITWAQ